MHSLLVVVHSAGIPDSTGGKLLVAKLFTRRKRNIYNRWCRLKLLWADGGYEATAVKILALRNLP